MNTKKVMSSAAEEQALRLMNQRQGRRQIITYLQNAQEPLCMVYPDEETAQAWATRWRLKLGPLAPVAVVCRDHEVTVSMKVVPRHS